MIEVAKPALGKDELSLWYQDFLAAEKAQFEYWKSKCDDPVDSDGYPTDVALMCIETWPSTDHIGLMGFVESLWHQKWFGWHTEDCVDKFDSENTVRTYNISTAGWSGNESIIKALERNEAFWSLNWQQSRRGGHYIFVVDLLK